MQQSLFSRLQKKKVCPTANTNLGSSHHTMAGHLYHNSEKTVFMRVKNSFNHKKLFYTPKTVLNSVKSFLELKTVNIN